MCEWSEWEHGASGSELIGTEVLTKMMLAREFFFPRDVAAPGPVGLT